MQQTTEETPVGTWVAKVVGTDVNLHGHRRRRTRKWTQGKQSNNRDRVKLQLPATSLTKPESPSHDNSVLRRNDARTRSYPRIGQGHDGDPVVTYAAVTSPKGRMGPTASCTRNVIMRPRKSKLSSPPHRGLPTTPYATFGCENFTTFGFPHSPLYSVLENMHQPQSVIISPPCTTHLGVSHLEGDGHVASTVPGTEHTLAVDDATTQMDPNSCAVAAGDSISTYIHRKLLNYLRSLQIPEDRVYVAANLLFYSGITSRSIRNLTEADLKAVGLSIGVRLKILNSLHGVGN